MIATEAKHSKGIQLNKRFLLSYFVHLDRTGNDDVKRRPEMGCSKIGRLYVYRDVLDVPVDCRKLGPPSARLLLHLLHALM